MSDENKPNLYIIIVQIITYLNFIAYNLQSKHCNLNTENIRFKKVGDPVKIKYEYEGGSNEYTDNYQMYMTDFK